MEGFILTLEIITKHVVEIGAIIFEFIGIFFMFISVFRSLIRYFRNQEDGPQLEEGISTALEFLMCGEVLKTITASNMDDYIALAAIIILRFVLAYEVHWERSNKLKQEKK